MVLYRCDDLDDANRKVIVNHLLEKDRFTCFSKLREVGVIFFRPTETYFEQEMGFRFSAEEIPNFIFNHFIRGSRKVGTKNPDFVKAITPQFICLICTVMYHCLSQWTTGRFVKPMEFSAQNGGSMYRP